VLGGGATGLLRTEGPPGWIGVVERSGGGATETTGCSEAACCGAAGMAALTGRPSRVTPAGANTSTDGAPTRETLGRITIPGRTTGGALTTTEGGVPTGAGTMIPAWEPGGAGTNTPLGPTGRA